MPPFRRFRKSAATKTESFKSHHRYEHWYLDNQIYFITARCRDSLPRLRERSSEDNLLGPLRSLHKTLRLCTVDHKPTRQPLPHARLSPYRRKPRPDDATPARFHRKTSQRHPTTTTACHSGAKSGNRDYFDGCIRNEKQCRLAYKYTQRQSVRHGIAQRLA